MDYRDLWLVVDISRFDGDIIESAADCSTGETIMFVKPGNGSIFIVWIYQDCFWKFVLFFY